MTRVTALLAFAACGALSVLAGPAPAKKTVPYYRAAKQAIRPQQSGGAVVVNAASFLPGISPGGLATIFGKDLSTVNDIVLANSDPFPNELANVQVVVNGLISPIFSVAYAGGQDQISFQVPYSTATGPSAAEIQVYNFGSLVADFFTDSFTEDPGIFMYQGNYAIAQSGTDGSLIGPNNPAFAGEVLVLYTTGLGPLTLNLQDGYGAPSDPLAHTQDPFQVQVDGENAEIQFSGLSPGFVGLYQVNFVVPRDIPSGNATLQIFSPYANSNQTTLPIY